MATLLGARMVDANDDGVILPGFAVGGFRSLFEVQFVGPMRKVNLLAGPNNAGKSNVLAAVADVLCGKLHVGELWSDSPQTDRPAPLLVRVAHRPLSSNQFTQRAPALTQPVVLEQIQKALSRNDDGLVWLEYELRDTSPRWSLTERQFLPVAHSVPGAEAWFTNSSRELTGTWSMGESGANAIRVMSRLFPLVLPRVLQVPAFRQITRLEDGAAPDLSGRGLIRQLADLRNPDAGVDHDALQAKFESVNSFAREVFQDDTVSISTNSSATQINVRQRGRTFDLRSFGTGLHQVVILATVAVTTERSLVCIEEPEIHLHPLLQRKFVEYLSSATDNQYLIATHSAHMLDHVQAAIFQVERSPIEGTRISRSSTPQEVSELCRDLGYRPSDLIQANCVIWVEGPADRIYINRWIDLRGGEDLIEGIHFSIMFYGGGLLSHLSGDEDAVEDFIELRKLNRHSVVVIDSDRSGPEDSINDTKTRVATEFNSTDTTSFAWIHECRTIENYLPPHILRAAVASVHPNSRHIAPKDRWQQPLVLMTDRKRSNADKVRVARVACSLFGEEDFEEGLGRSIDILIAFIRDANGAQ